MYRPDGASPSWVFRADGTGLRHPQRLRLGPPTVVGGHFRNAVVTSAHPGNAGSGAKACTMWATHTKRKPMLLLRLSGWLLLR
ncbi:MAG: hypothetical protein NTX45_26765 [Proteobacteria bacterium]|nr:hypothetical protein [Pseudomonadota bacterium]